MTIPLFLSLVLSVQQLYCGFGVDGLSPRHYLLLGRNSTYDPSIELLAFSLREGFRR